MWGLMSFIRDKTLNAKVLNQQHTRLGTGIRGRATRVEGDFLTTASSFLPPLFSFVNAVTLSSAESSLCCGEAGEKKRKRAGHDGKGKDRRQASPPFPSSHRPPRAFYFSIIAIFIGVPSGSLCGGERSSNRFDVNRKLTRGVY